jgi:hypothetical protein
MTKKQIARLDEIIVDIVDNFGFIRSELRDEYAELVMLHSRYVRG